MAIGLQLFQCSKISGMHPSVVTGKKKNSMNLNLFSNLDSFVRNMTPKAGDQKSQILMSDIEVMQGSEFQQSLSH